MRVAETMPEDTYRQADASGLPQLPPDPLQAGEELLILQPRVASELFQRLDEAAQLTIIEAVEDPSDREELYYLVPDCTSLVRESRVESLLEIIATVFGTGLACGILSAVSPEQFTAMFERTSLVAGAAARDTVMMWVAELTELEPEELSALLSELDPELLAELFRGRVEVPERLRGLTVDSGMIELEQVEFGEDEQARLMGELLWSASPELFIAMLRTLLTEKGAPRAEEGEPDADVDEAQPKPDNPRTQDWLATFDMTRIDEILPPSRPRRRPTDR